MYNAFKKNANNKEKDYREQFLIGRIPVPDVGCNAVVQNILSGRLSYILCHWDFIYTSRKYPRQTGILRNV